MRTAYFPKQAGPDGLQVLISCWVKRKVMKYFDIEVKIGSSLPLNLGTSGFTCLQKHGRRQREWWMFLVSTRVVSIIVTATSVQFNIRNTINYGLFYLRVWRKVKSEQYEISVWILAIVYYCYVNFFKNNYYDGIRLLVRIKYWILFTIPL